VLFGISMVLETLNVSFVRAFEGVESMERIAVITVAERFVFGLFGAIAIMTDGGLVMLAAAHVGAALVLSVMSTAAWGRMQQRIRTAADAGTLKRLLRESMPFAVASVFSIGYTRIDLVILSLMGSASDVGVYSASFRITEAMVFIPTAIVASIFPVLARAHAAGAGFEFLFGKYFAVLSAAGVLLGAVVFGLAEPIVLILFGGGYTGSIEVLRILCLMVPFTFMNAFIGTALIAVNKEKLSTGAIIFCALFNGTVNSFAIPYFGFIGAAATKVGTEIAGVIFQVIMLHRSTSYKGLYTQWIVRSTPN
jgi:O-antigen/teichoic acid export membrane protein